MPILMIGYDRTRQYFSSPAAALRATHCCILRSPRIWRPDQIPANLFGIRPELENCGFRCSPTVTGLRKRQQFFGSTQVDTMSETPQIAGRQPIPVKVEEGKSYWWCACGLSKTQPFCDGSHKATTFVPVEFKPTASAEVWFCACKRSSRKPMCDGSHQKL